MHDEMAGRSSALADLRTRLADGLARSGLDKTQLAARSRLGRTTVHNALQSDSSAPTARTVAALARALRLPVEEILALHRSATEPATDEAPGPGRPIRDWSPYALEVHPAGPASTFTGRLEPLSQYVHRRHDQVLGRAVQASAAGNSSMVVLVGESSTGKTRACWEAVQPLAERGWRLWHPFDPTRAEAALEELHHVKPRTVVWLNEAQHYLDAPRGVGERVAAAVHSLLLDDDRAPVLIVGTLWPEYARKYLALPVPGSPDSHSRTRELLASRTVTVPSYFDGRALAAAAAFAGDGDRLLAKALRRAAGTGRVAQDLAGAPELLRRYETGSPAARALLEAAIDARRLGTGLHLPLGFLVDAASDYLADTDYEQLDADWAEAALAELARPVHGGHAPLRRVTVRPARPVRLPPSKPQAAASPAGPVSPIFRLADYLEQPVTRLAATREQAGDTEGTEILLSRAARSGESFAVTELARLREQDGDHEGAEAIARRAASVGDVSVLVRLAEIREQNGLLDQAEALLREAAGNGAVAGAIRMAELRRRGGDLDGAEELLRQAADAGDTSVLPPLVLLLEERGRQQAAELTALRGVDAGDTEAAVRLTHHREKVGNRQGAEALARRAADAGTADALNWLAAMRKRAGDGDGARELLRCAAAVGGTDASSLRSQPPAVGSPAETASPAGENAPLDPYALVRVAEQAEHAGHSAQAEDLMRRAARTGAPIALIWLAAWRDRVGHSESAARLLKEAADVGERTAQTNALWPHGLDLDSTPSQPWL